MKNLLIASITTLALAGGAAQAADMSMPLKARPMPAPVYTWTGCYVEGGGGYGMFNNSHYEETAPGGVPLSSEITTGGRGYYGTVGGGCDYQVPIGGLGNFVIGVLGGYDFMDLKGGFYSPALAAVSNAYEKENNAWNVGGRIGYLVTPNLLTYVSGGYASTHFSSITSTAGVSLPGQRDNGYFIGGGAETSLSPWLPTGWFLRTDYKVSTYRATDSAYSFAGAPTGFGEHSNIYVQQIGTELMYRFNFH